MPRKGFAYWLWDISSAAPATGVAVGRSKPCACNHALGIVVMEKGRIGAIGTPRELYESPQTRFIADFIGDANLIEGELATRNGSHVFRAGPMEMEVASSSGNADGPVALAIRPHRIRVGAVEGSVVSGILLRQAYLGSRIESIVGTPVGELLVFSDSLQPMPPAGSTVGVHFERSDARITARG